MGGPPPDAAPGPPGGPEGDLPEAAVRRLESSAFSSGLTVPDFAACLELGLEPVALVQGFCVMQWGWYGPGSGYMRGMTPYVGYGRRRSPDARRLLRDLPLPARLRLDRAPHLGPEPRAALGRGRRGRRGTATAYGRMLEEAQAQHGAHGVIGVHGPGGQRGRHRDDRVPLPRHRGHRRGRAAAGRRRRRGPPTWRASG